VLAAADFFISVINQKTTILLVTAAVYLLVFLFFSVWWYLIVRWVQRGVGGPRASEQAQLAWGRRRWLVKRWECMLLL
jgi:hypothetical protein